MKKTVLFFGLLWTVCSGVVFAQEAEDAAVKVEAAVPVAAAPETETAAPAAAAPEAKTDQDFTPEWLWGEVVSVNPTLNQLVVKHMDYESYEEVQTTLTIEEKTMFENASDLTHVLVGDHVTVDYKTKDGSNIIELIVVEKPIPESEQDKQGITLEEAKPLTETSEVAPAETVDSPAQGK